MTYSLAQEWSKMWTCVNEMQQHIEDQKSTLIQMTGLWHRTVRECKSLREALDESKLIR